ncbi:YdcF family protein [uncultured Corynebacterium sp.]|uniref:YdcF family protein n=1 Tax=uncultured Corynebacterium sp. TaxID=159447 RepID=UPI0025F7D9F2|nr:ElyC/SanA/YdcF family protein [uncultured Corynebacterium sp.]
MTPTWILGVITAVLGVWTAVRIIREPRRVRNGLWIVATLFFLWFTVVVRELQKDSESSTATMLIFGALTLGALAILAAGIYLLVNGAVVVRREGFGVSTLVPAVFGVALVGTIAALVIGILLLGNTTGEHPVLSQLLLFIAAPLGTLTVAMFLVQLVAFAIYSVLYSRITRPDHADAVVVLGAGLRGTEPTPLLAARIDRGIAMLQELQDAGKDAEPGVRLVLSGGQGADEEISEAEAMARYAERAGVPRSSMVLEDRSTTTGENLLNTKALLGEDARLVVVTSNYHALRAAALTEQLGLRAQVIGSRTASYFVPAGFLREFVAVVTMYRRTNVRVWLVCAVLWLLFIGALFVIANMQHEVVDAALAGTLVPAA